MHDGPDDLLGWTTDSLILLDALAPGLISRVLTAAPARRQAIFTVLASRQLAALHNEAVGRPDDSDDEKLAHVLRQGCAREVLEYAFKDVPEGWLGTLERLGGQPMKVRNSYIKLHSIFANPSHRRKAKALRHVGQITEKMLLILDALDERWVHAEVLKRIESIAEAKDFNRAIAFAQSVCSRATDEAVAEAISRLPPQSSLTRLLHRYVQRADRYPDHPAARTEDLRPLTTSRDLIEAGRRFRNCLPRKVGDVLVGSAPSPSSVRNASWSFGRCRIGAAGSSGTFMDPKMIRSRHTLLKPPPRRACCKASLAFTTARAARIGVGIAASSGRANGLTGRRDSRTPHPVATAATPRRSERPKERPCPLLERPKSGTRASDALFGSSERSLGSWSYYAARSWVRVKISFEGGG